MENIETSISLNICSEIAKESSTQKQKGDSKRQGYKKTNESATKIRKENDSKLLGTGALKSKTAVRNRKTTGVDRNFSLGLNLKDKDSLDSDSDDTGQEHVKSSLLLDQLQEQKIVPAAPLFSTSNFSNLNLHPHMVANLRQNLEIEKLTTVQNLSIPVIMSGRDALIRSPTGSGKTFAYAVPVVEALHSTRPKIRRSEGILAVIVVPTRELALQTYEWFLKLLKPYTWIVPGYLAGGEKRKSEKARLRRGVNILVSTPGRLVDHVCHTRNLQLQRVKFLVLDEADRMLELGYEKDISSIVSSLDECQSKGRIFEWGTHSNPESEGNYSNAPSQDEGRKRQTILLSATLTKEVYKLAGLTMTDPSKIDASGGDVEEDVFIIPPNITQWYIVVPPKFRLVVLAAFIVWKCKMTKDKKMLVFCATQDMVDYMTELLIQVLGTTATKRGKIDDVPLEDEGEGLVDIDFFKLHGNMSQQDRIDVFKSFRAVKAGVLLCTDVASRGLDLPRVDWVLQWTAPPTPTDYVHRVGRTARGGKTGAALLFLAPTETPFLEELARKNIRLKEETVDRCLQQLLAASIAVGMLDKREARTVEAAATAIQLRFEDAVLGCNPLHKLGCKAFTSFVRFYAAYPKESRASFCIRRLHLGHYAKGFALRDPPSAIGANARRFTHQEGNSEKGSTMHHRGEKRSSSAVAPRGGPAAKRLKPTSLRESRSHMLITSEYASGLDDKKKKKKK